MNSSLGNRYEEDEQLQISQFIKDPTTLKLLILAGTNIKSVQLNTVAKCTNLIKLDLSSNMLSDIPIRFDHFIQLKILYLHDNNIFTVNVQNSTIQYITLFNNPYKNYRQKIVSNNPKLMAVDYNIVTNKQKINLTEPALFTQLKWPIVQTSSNLQSQEDYLNLLKAQIFVITNLYKKANSIQFIQNVFQTLKTYKNYQKMISEMTDQMKFKKSCVIDAVSQWKNYINKKRKIQLFLKSRGKQHLLYNNLDIRKQKRSPQTNFVIQRFMNSIRSRLKARSILQSHLNNYRSFIPVSQTLIEIYKTSSSNSLSQKIYFMKSQLHFLQKIFLYAKRLLFNKKQYDLCDNFQKIVKKDKKQFYIFRSTQANHNEKSFLLDSIRRSMSLVLSEKDIDRQHFLYNKKGHKQIALKSRYKLKLSPVQKQKIKQKISLCEKKINRVFQKYDHIVSYSISDDKIFAMLLKIIRYFNAGNSSTILSNQAAYFQTQVVFETEQQKVKKQKIFVGLQFYMKRSIAANIIQKFWRRVTSKRNSSIQVLKTIRQKRASKIISHWLRNLPFEHRNKINKTLSYRKTIQKSHDMYIQLQVYMKIPRLSNRLKIKQYQPFQHESNQIVYSSLHLNTYVEIVQLCKRKWLRIVFPSVQKALQAEKLILFTTFRFYYNGFHLKLFSYFEAQETQSLQTYQKRVKHLYQIDVSVSKQQVSSGAALTSKKLPIQNSDPYFVWAEVGQRGIEHKFQIQKKSIPISIFVYNKHKKPLKINCDVNWINTSSIFYNKKTVSKSATVHGASIRLRTPTKKFSISEKRNSFFESDQTGQHYVGKVLSNDKRSRRQSQITPHSTALLRNLRARNVVASQKIQVDLLSQTLNIRKK